MTDEKREGMSEERPMGIQTPRMSDKTMAKWFRSMGEADEDITLAAEFLLDLADRLDRLRAELENVRAQAAADRGFQTENSHLRAENAELRRVENAARAFHPPDHVNKWYCALCLAFNAIDERKSP